MRRVYNEATMSTLRGKRITLGVTGGIAAYKAAELCRLLVKEGAEVRVIMTPAAEAFITPLTLQTLSGHKVGLTLLDASEEAEIGHIRLADETDLVVIAPASSDAIARMAAGMANDLLTAVVLATRAHVVLAPAMNVNMWENPLTQANLDRLVNLSRFSTVGPDVGSLACGWVGAGRMMEAADVRDAVVARLANSDTLQGRHVVITAGPTFEPVDDVRFLGNRSSGKMGFALAAVAAMRGANVTLISGPVPLPTPAGKVARIDVQTALQMQAAVNDAVATADVVVMSAAVADFRPTHRVAGKLSRRDGPLTSLPLTANPDILASLGKSRADGRPFLVGFAAEALPNEDAMVARAKAKLVEKGCDAIVANDVGNPAIGFGSDHNEGALLFADGGVVRLPKSAKRTFAGAIWDQIGARLGPLTAPGQ